MTYENLCYVIIGFSSYYVCKIIKDKGNPLMLFFWLMLIIGSILGIAIITEV